MKEREAEMGTIDIYISLLDRLSALVLHGIEQEQWEALVNERHHCFGFSDDKEWESIADSLRWARDWTQYIKWGHNKAKRKSNQ